MTSQRYEVAKIGQAKSGDLTTKVDNYGDFQSNLQGVVVKLIEFFYSCSIYYLHSSELTNKSSHARYPNTNVVDGSCAPAEISNLFSSKFESLLYSSPDSHSRDSLFNNLSESISTSDLSSISISEAIVYDAISQFKPGKHDGSTFLSNHFIHEIMKVLFLDNWTW